MMKMKKFELLTVFIPQMQPNTYLVAIVLLNSKLIFYSDI